MQWTIQDLGALGELIGAIGVVITLIYLAYQIKQNTEQLEQNTLTAKTAAVAASNTALRATRQSLYGSSAMSEIYELGNHQPGELDDVARTRYRLVMMNIVDVMLDIYTQTATTGFSPEMWETTGEKLVERVLSTPGGKWFWTNYAETYPPYFRAEVERILHSPAAA